jgi:3-hydroxypropanoate dehydrogenase
MLPAISRCGAMNGRSNGRVPYHFATANMSDHAGQTPHLSPDCSHPADPDLLNRLFAHGRTFSHWLPRPVDDALLMRIWNLARLGPTAANSQPLRVLFVRSEAAKAKLKPCLAPGNVEKTMQAPVTALFAADLAFYDHLPRLFPHTDARSWFAGESKTDAARETATRNSTLQAAYFMLAARALGLDCGPMSGFDAALINQTFFPDGRHEVNFICNLGHGDPQTLHPRHPRLEFEEACRII